MFFPRRDFLKFLAGWFGASQLPSGQTNAAPAPSILPEGSPQSTMHAAPEPPASIKAEFDVIVVGGGISGTACAIAAARNGAKVALVHERSMLGGNSSSEVRLYPEGNDAHAPWIRESGIHDEFHVEDRVRNHVFYREGLMNCHWDLVLYEWCIREKNLTLMLNTHMHRVTMASPTKIASIHCIQLGTEKTFDLSAANFVDCTGDGVLAYRAGAHYRWGKEAKSEYGESLAPDEATDKVMGNTLFFRAVDVGKPVKFVRPEWAAEYKDEKELSFRGHSNVEAGHWWIEIGEPHHPIHDNEIIRHEALRTLLGVWDHVKNKGDHGAENMALEFVGFWPYKREARRIIGDAVLTEQHVKSPQQLDDAVAYGCWGCDIHFPGGSLNRYTRPYIPPANANFEKFGTIPYGIGLKSLYSRNIENLMMAGRPISGSYVAFSSTRVLSTGCIVGQAVGTFAAACMQHKLSPRETAKQHAKAIQQTLLRQDCHIPGVENEDEKDLARQATATASSEAILSFGEGTTVRELTHPRAQLFPMSEDRIESVSLWLTSKAKDAVELTVGLRAAPCVWDFRSNDDLATAKTTVPPGHDGWVEFKFEQKVEPRKLYWVHTPVAKGVSWKSIAVPYEVSHATPPGAVAAQRMGPTRWEPHSTSVCMAIQVKPESKPFGPQNVIRGTHRPDKWSNIWISSNELPASLELKWEGAKKFNTVILTFDTNQGRRENAALFRYPDCVKDYDVEAQVSGEWKTVASIKDNYMRHREHRFDRVEAAKLRLKVLATNGAPAARVYEVRVYDEA